jgi:chemotaxis protein CheC
MKDSSCEIKENKIVMNKVMSEREKDALQEAGNIAAGSAATALSKLVSEKIMIDVTECKLTRVDEIPQILGGPTELVVAVNMVIPNRKLCSILMLFPHKSAKELCDMFSKRKLGTTKEITPDELNSLTEIGNICICAYLNALSKLLDIILMPSPPSVASDMIASILQDVAISADEIGEYAIIIETNFLHKYGSNKGHFMFILDQKSKEAIFNVFNVDVKDVN